MQFEIEYGICVANHDDVIFELNQARTEKRKPSYLVVGDEMWRLAKGIGPISVDHNHWIGDHISLSAPQAEYVRAALLAHQAAGNPWPEK